MPSPFPGMDPFLEDATVWPGVHQDLITYLRARINSLLPEGYVANIQERLYVVQHDRDIYPDVALLRRPSAPDATATAALGVLTSDEPMILEADPVEVEEGYIEILRIGEPGRVVTAIELLSPTNKASTEGRELYRAKQEELLASSSHLLEIDLIRQGRHTVACPPLNVLASGQWRSLVSLHRAGRKRRFEVWPATLPQRLPRFHIPLADADPPIVVDLQTLLERCYDECGYARLLNYRRDPPGPLTPGDAVWIEELLRARGLRTA